MQMVMNAIDAERLVDKGRLAKHLTLSRSPTTGRDHDRHVWPCIRRMPGQAEAVERPGHLHIREQQRDRVAVLPKMLKGVIRVHGRQNLKSNFLKDRHSVEQKLPHHRRPRGPKAQF